VLDVHGFPLAVGENPLACHSPLLVVATTTEKEKLNN
jgi:hypothetical protein